MFTDKSSPATVREGASNRQTRFVFFAGFGGLLLLLCVLGASAISFLSQIRVRDERIRQEYVSRDRVLQKLRSDIYTSGTHVRDFLLDTNDALELEHREQFLDTKRQIEEGIAEYRKLVPAGEEQPFLQFSRELTSYMNALTPVLDWSSAERQARASVFVQNELLPRRMNAISFADRIQKISEQQLDASSDAVAGVLASFRVKLLSLLMLAITLGITLAGIALWRLLRLEQEAQARFQEIVSTREELKRLSTELVSAQESERRRISRELHDEVGQVLTAIMLGLGNLRSAIRDDNSAEALHQLQQVEDMTQRNASVVRNLSLLLRPTMLDDLGLAPALKWYAREVSRTGPMQVDLVAEAFVEDLPDAHRTCVFRIVQEAVRNASRHSGAREAQIHIRETAVPGNARALTLSVQDDGRGFDPSQESGLGILGMQERVASLNGTFGVHSAPGKGTIVTLSLPLPPDHRLATDAPESEYQEIRPFRTA
jgi:signal transduction histidine kinase